MSSVLRRFRGLGIALAVLAISAGAVFAAAPSMKPSAHAADQAKGQVAANVDPTASESADPSESPEPSESVEPSDSPAAPASPDASGSPNPDTHGALVSTAAQMPTPSGFPNHGAFVSCVAHMNVSLTGFDWTTVTPEACGLTTTTSPTVKSNHASSNGANHGAAGQARAAAARAKHGGSGH